MNPSQQPETKIPKEIAELLDKCPITTPDDLERLRIAGEEISATTCDKCGEDHGDCQCKPEKEEVPTPRTDTDARLSRKFHRQPVDYVSLAFSRQLERDLLAAQAKIVGLERREKNYCEDWAQDDTDIKKVCARFGIDTVGDSYGVPPMSFCVEQLGEITDQLKARVAELEKEKVTAEWQRNADTECINRITQHGYESDLKIQELTAKNQRYEAALRKVAKNSARMGDIETAYFDKINIAKEALSTPPATQAEPPLTTDEEIDIPTDEERAANQQELGKISRANRFRLMFGQPKIEDSKGKEDT